MLYKSIFKITKMDCPSEEQMIRMKLEGIPEIKKLEFDIANRMLEVIHEGEVNTFDSAIHSLNLGSQIESSNETDVSEIRHEDTHQRKMLWWVLVINFSFFVIEMLYGWLSRSMGLIADSLDMLADSIVYGLSLHAVGAALARKKKVARLSGYFQMILAFLGLAEVLRRFFWL
jgi:cation transport ATPase